MAACDLCSDPLREDGHLWEIKGAPSDSEIAHHSIGRDDGKTRHIDVESTVLTPNESMMSDWRLCMMCDLLLRLGRIDGLNNRVRANITASHPFEPREAIDLMCYLAEQHVNFLHKYGRRK